MSLPRAYKTRGVILRGRHLGEADRIVTLFTSERGKIDAVAKGVRRAKSQLAGRLEFGNECLLAMHRGRSLDIIVGADIECAYWERIVEPERFAAFSLVAEVIDGFCEPDLAMQDVYRLLTGVVGAIATLDDPARLIPRFSLLLLAALGLAPPVDVCVRCSAPLIERAWLDADSGGFIDDRCRERYRDFIELERDDIANLQTLAAPRGDERAALYATLPVTRAIEQLLAYHLGRQPKASIV
ncbi:MAG TPA: DNA repair protein RecO [Candidatus Dormibacteraeota bacterium]|nr:DNA repair protein RecO [Candidatus Dormibacteraeota bacterium]